MSYLKQLVEEYKRAGVFDEILNVCRAYKISYSNIDIFYDFEWQKIYLSERAIVKILGREFGIFVGTTCGLKNNDKRDEGYIFVDPESLAIKVIPIPEFVFNSRFSELVNLLPIDSKGRPYPIQTIAQLIDSNNRGINDLIIRALIEDQQRFNQRHEQKNHSHRGDYSPSSRSSGFTPNRVEGRYYEDRGARRNEKRFEDRQYSNDSRNRDSGFSKLDYSKIIRRGYAYAKRERRDGYDY